MNPEWNCVWLNRDLRFQDNPALSLAVKEDNPFFILYFEPSHLSPKRLKDKMGAYSWWHFNSLTRFKAECESLSVPFVYRAEMTEKSLYQLSQNLSLKHFFWNQAISPDTLKLQARFKDTLKPRGIGFTECAPDSLIDWKSHKTKDGKVFQVYTPFWKSLWQKRESISVPVPDLRYAIQKKRIPRLPSGAIDAGEFSESEYLNKIPKSKAWYLKFDAQWAPGEDAAHRLLESFINEKIRDYKTSRDFPSLSATSRLSPYFVSGQLTLRSAWHSVLAKAKNPEALGVGEEHFLKELVWREFATYILFHFPDSVEKSLKLPFEKLPWKGTAKQLKLWQRGQTGYPIIDAGMRELWHTGWMHNRVRMIVASFLVKDLSIEWQKGADWFLDTLVDADFANNTLGWQWAAGCGVDAAPYFRVFNPVLQGEKFDPDGIYIKRWVPELRDVPAANIHRVFECSETDRRSWGLELGKDYPWPLVDHSQARDEILKLFAKLKTLKNYQ
jgi:deoxyribodipyrimidine photo-lyase